MKTLATSKNYAAHCLLTQGFISYPLSTIYMYIYQLLRTTPSLRGAMTFFKYRGILDEFLPHYPLFFSTIPSYFSLCV